MGKRVSKQLLGSEYFAFLRIIQRLIYNKAIGRAALNNATKLYM